MAKVVIKKLSGSTARQIGAKPAGVTRKRVSTADGTSKTILTLDAGSETFDSDLTYVFGKNVAKARRENKRVTGATDIAPAKL